MMVTQPARGVPKAEVTENNLCQSTDAGQLHAIK